MRETFGLASAGSRRKSDGEINTPLGQTSHYDEQAIRKSALQFNVPTVTTITGAEALIEAIATKKSQAKIEVRSLQEIHGDKVLTVNK